MQNFRGLSGRQEYGMLDHFHTIGFGWVDTDASNFLMLGGRKSLFATLETFCLVLQFQIFGGLLLKELIAPRQWIIPNRLRRVI